ncbi:GGDEF domain-containing protein [Candidatus Nanopelagicus hibericus]|uniref:GGDEF domain-containing protein n=2 Tax=Candidatus Nanopelagicus hibericus TaxID=1884915 RepID=A0A249KAC5_9ACTN|nr:GGDEF domain-containing protein [Candidatus Nanopelagicus hibericus]
MLKWITSIALLLHLVFRLISPENNVVVDLLLFNLVGILAAGVALNAPLLTDRISAVALGLAALIWSLGSFFSTWNSFFQAQVPDGISDLCYSIFYPLVFLGVTRSFTYRRSITALELLDTVIIAVGLVSILTAFLLKPAMLSFEGSSWQVFTSILYPVGDLLLLALVLIYLLLTPINIRSILIASGLLSFALSDLFFIWSSLNGTYTFGSITDDGWILGLLLLSLSLGFPSSEAKFSDKISSYSATIALIASSCLLGVAALKPGYFPSFILIPGFITIALAFIRMSFALSEANSAGTERVLARTDELTGLSNRRNFLFHLAQLKGGYIFLLDLDGFKRINDSLGHDAGDQLLKQVANRFSRVIPTGAQIARLGGDEFGVIAQVDQLEAFELAQAIKATLSYPVTLTTSEVAIDVSIGYASIDPTVDVIDALRRADLAMYQVKEKGGGPVLWEKGKFEKIG